ncbi:hypothetical protein ON010_g13622 [Phytophthora cinnamomi]|nr:hypothetical protein ON010_g13622 [Phytophthora cinnamomi]
MRTELARHQQPLAHHLAPLHQRFVQQRDEEASDEAERVLDTAVEYPGLEEQHDARSVDGRLEAVEHDGALARAEARTGGRRVRLGGSAARRRGSGAACACGRVVRHEALRGGAERCDVGSVGARGPRADDAVHQVAHLGVDAGEVRVLVVLRREVDLLAVVQAHVDEAVGGDGGPRHGVTDAVRALGARGLALGVRAGVRLVDDELGHVGGQEKTVWPCFIVT